MKFGVGQPVRRFEDQTLITGKGRYTDDLHLDKAAQAYVVRSRVAHANIRKIDATAARGMPGVLLVLTGEDVKADGLGDVPCHAPLRDGARAPTSRGACSRGPSGVRPCKPAGVGNARQRRKEPPHAPRSERHIVTRVGMIRTSGWRVESSSAIAVYSGCP